MSPRIPSRRERILAVCAERGLVGRDAETAVDAYLAGHIYDADGIRVTRILEVEGQKVTQFEEYAKIRWRRSEYVAITLYAITFALGLGGFVLSAYGRTPEGTYMGAGAFVTGILSALAFRAAIRWRRAITRE